MRLFSLLCTTLKIANGENQLNLDRQKDEFEYLLSGGLGIKDCNKFTVRRIKRRYIAFYH